MPCPTHEQLTALSLDIADQVALAEHVEQCDFCAKELASQRNVVDHLTAIHDEIDARHPAARVELLRRLPAAMNRRSPSRWRRWAMGGAAAAAALLLSFVALSPNRLSAMERIVNAVRDVRSFSYRLTNDSEVPPSQDKPARAFQGNTFTFWRRRPLPNRTNSVTYARPRETSGFITCRVGMRSRS